MKNNYFELNAFPMHAVAFVLFSQKYSVHYKVIAHNLFPSRVAI
jgi:hypothetical protein